MSTSRRAADEDPIQKILGETAKLVGNAGFDRFIMDVGRQQEVRYEQDESRVTRALNNFFFHDLEELSDVVFELKMFKTKINCDLPIQIGIFVFTYANYACWNSITIASTPCWIGETFSALKWIPILPTCPWRATRWKSWSNPTRGPSLPPSSASGFPATTRRSTPPTTSANRAF